MMVALSIDEIKTQFPDEWVLLGNPQTLKSRVLSGIILYHSKDKKEVCYLGRNLTNGYDTITITYTGEHKSMRKLGIMRRV
jgi:hypothetical protein